MFFLVFLALAGCCSAKDVIHRMKHGNVTLRAMPKNPYMMIHADDGYPIRIEYFQTIVQTTGVMVRVSFSDESGPLVAAENETILNICDILDRALFDPESIEARYNVASNFGMTGSTCPIEVGVRILPISEYSIELMTMDFGDGTGYYIMTVETANPTVETENRKIEMENGTMLNNTIMEAQVNFELTRSNETLTENSSVVLSTPSIIASIVTALIAITFTC